MPSKSPSVEIEVDNRVVRVSNPDRVYFPEIGRDQARPGRVLPRRRARASSTRCFERPCMLHRFPKGLAGDKVHQKRLPGGAPDWVETVQLHFPRWNRTADELCVTELGSRDLGGADVDRRVPPLEQPPRRHREARRVAHRPRPGPAVRLRARCSGSPTSPTRCSTSSARSASRRPAGGKGLHVYVRIRPDHGFKDVRRAALAFAREVERRAPDDVTTTWWRKDRDPHAPVRRLQPERARPHHRRGVLRPRRARRPGLHPDPLGRGRRRRPARLHDLHRARSGSPSSATCTPTSTTHVFDIAPLLEWADARRARRAPRPPGRTRRADDAAEHDRHELMGLDWANKSGVGAICRPAATCTPSSRAASVERLAGWSRSVHLARISARRSRPVTPARRRGPVGPGALHAALGHLNRRAGRGPRRHGRADG